MMSPSDQASPTSLSEEALQLEEQGRLEEALAKWRIIGSQAPDAVALMHWGRVASDAHEDTEAVEALSRAIAARPSWPAPLELLGIHHRDHGRLPEAESSFRRALAIKPGARTWTLLGDILERQGRTVESRVALEEAIRLDPRHDEAHFLLGYTFHDDPVRADESYRQALEIDPHYGAAHRELGWALRRSGNLEAAESHVRRALEIGDSDVWAWIYLGNILWAKDCLDASEAAFRRAIAADPSFAAAHWALADVLKATGRLQEAKAALRETLRLDLTNVAATVRLAVLLQQLGRPRRARRLLQRALRLDPESKEVQRWLESLQASDSTDR